MIETVVPIITEVGEVYGRDAIFLHKVDVINESTFELTGDFNGTLCSNLKDGDDPKYRLTFKGVYLFKMIELDFDEIEYKSSFDLIRNSRKILRLKAWDKENSIGKIDDTFNHYVFRTYDTVFEIIGKGFELKLEEKV